MNQKLKIDTSNNLVTKIQLGNTTLEEERKSPSEQNVLELIEKIFKKEKLKLEDIDSIEINTGPGSFTGLRVGVSIVNALSFSGNISVNGKDIGKITLPEY